MNKFYIRPAPSHVWLQKTDILLRRVCSSDTGIYQRVSGVRYQWINTRENPNLHTP